MERIDRSMPPGLKPIEKLQVAPIEKTSLDNGVPVYLIRGSEQDVVKVEFVFKAGRWYEPLPVVARATNQLISEGTKKYSAEEIANQIEYYGANMNAYAGNDLGVVNIFSLNKHLESVLPVIKDLLTEANFPDEEVDLYKKNSIQKLRVNLQKPEYLGDINFKATLFGEDTPYGYFSKEEHYKALRRGQLIDFYRNAYDISNCSIIVSGNPDSNVVKLLNREFGSIKSNRKFGQPTHHAPHTAKPQKVHIEKEDTMQAALRIGRRIVGKSHPDHPGLFVLNAMLGGYFGSRLMSNLREEKGYTYGVYSQLAPLMHDAYWSVSTEVGIDVYESALSEIYKEIDKVQQYEAGAAEMNLLRNYLSARLIQKVDGPFNLASVLRGLIVFDLDIDYFYGLFDTVRSIEAGDLRNLAQKYLRKEDLYEVVLSNKVAVQPSNI